MVTWQRVAEIARELPEMEETTSWGKPSFAVRGKKFAGLSTRHEGAMWTRCDREERPLLVDSNPREPHAAAQRRRSIMRACLVVLVAASTLFVLPSAGAKNFGPGDLRVCNATRCVAIVNREVLPRLGSFYYSGPSPARVRGPALGAPYYELRFDNDYVTGIVATRRLDRFLSDGVYLGRFARNGWYAVPRPLSEELRRLTVGLRPLRVTRAALAKSR